MKDKLPEFKSKPVIGLDDLGDEKYSLGRLAMSDGGRQAIENRKKSGNYYKSVSEGGKKGAIKSNKKRATRIKVSNFLTGEIYGVWEFVSKFSKEYNIKEGNIHDCLNKKLKHINGFAFETTNEPINENKIKVLPKKIGPSKSVILLDSLGNEIKEYISITNLMTEMNLPRKSNIIDICKGKRTKPYKGYLFKYKNSNS